MHIEKNVFDNVIHTVMDSERTKDNHKARAGSMPLGGREPPRDSVTCFTRSGTRERLTRGYEM
ncbi:hypothetical protein PIB30_115720, partial [Stylosanthes scabra]|nr:hypothetical protein [Stylosanthes scabra]